MPNSAITVRVMGEFVYVPRTQAVFPTDCFRCGADSAAPRRFRCFDLNRRGQVLLPMGTIYPSFCRKCIGRSRWITIGCAVLSALLIAPNLLNPPVGPGLAFAPLYLMVGMFARLGVMGRMFPAIQWITSTDYVFRNSAIAFRLQCPPVVSLGERVVEPRGWRTLSRRKKLIFGFVSALMSILSMTLRWKYGFTFGPRRQP